MKILNDKFQNLNLVLTDKYYRVFLRLLFTYGKVKRNEEKTISYLNHKIIVADCLSFIFQFKEMYVKGYYEFNNESEIPVIFDCGSNIGVSILFFKDKYHNAIIKAFEADPNISELLNKNLVTNSVKNVEVIAKAVWVNNDGIELGLEGADASSIFSNNKKIRVPSVRLKDLIEKEDRIDLLKLDIEGAETEVIEDCKDSLGRIKNIFIEYHSFIGKEQNLDRILTVLKSNNFRYFIKTDEPREKPLINHKSKISPDMDLQLNIFAYRL
jgi:FkbM family methyltransferase